MSRRIRLAAAGTTVLLASVAIAVAAGSVGAKGAGKPATGVVYAAITHTVGKTEFAAGNSVSKVLGNGAVTFELSVSTGSKPGTLSTKGTVDLFTKNGELSGTDSVDLVTNTDGTATFSNGKISLTKGSGLEKGHSFIGTFTGTAKTVTGPYVFNTKGTYR